MIAFAKGFVPAFLAMIVVLAAAGYAIGLVVFKEPPRRHEARGFSFVIPARWDCTDEGTETVCNAEDGEIAKRAIIVATSKTINANDTETFYESYLKTPKQPLNLDVTLAPPSRILYFRESTLGGRRWLDAAHEGALLPTFTSRYLVTTSGPTAMLITLSFHKDSYEENIALMDEVAASLIIR